MTSPRPRKAAKRSAKKKPAARPSKRGAMITMVHPRAARSRRSRVSREVVGVRCRVVGVHPDAEAIVLKDFYGQDAIVPVTSSQRDGRLARDLSPLIGRDVWLSLRLP